MLRLPLLAFLVLSACATADYAQREVNQLRYNCGDLVAIGRWTQLNEEVVPSDHPLGVSRRQIRIHIKHVVRGLEPRSTVLAVGTSHAQPRSDRDFLTVLAPQPDGTYSIRTAALWDVSPKPKLVEPCS